MFLLKDSSEETKQITTDTQMMEVHMSAMEAPLYQSYTVYIINKVRAKVEIHLGIIIIISNIAG